MILWLLQLSCLRLCVCVCVCLCALQVILSMHFIYRTPHYIFKEPVSLTGVRANSHYKLSKNPTVTITSGIFQKEVKWRGQVQPSHPVLKYEYERGEINQSFDAEEPHMVLNPPSDPPSYFPRDGTSKCSNEASCGPPQRGTV